MGAGQARRHRFQDAKSTPRNCVRNPGVPTSSRGATLCTGHLRRTVSTRCRSALTERCSATSILYWPRRRATGHTLSRPLVAWRESSNPVIRELQRRLLEDPGMATRCAAAIQPFREELTLPSQLPSWATARGKSASHSRSKRPSFMPRPTPPTPAPFERSSIRSTCRSADERIPLLCAGPSAMAILPESSFSASPASAPSSAAYHGPGSFRHCSLPSASTLVAAYKGKCVVLHGMRRGNSVQDNWEGLGKRSLDSSGPNNSHEDEP